MSFVFPCTGSATGNARNRVIDTGLGLEQYTDFGFSSNSDDRPTPKPVSIHKRVYPGCPRPLPSIIIAQGIQHKRRSPFFSDFACFSRSCAFRGKAQTNKLYTVRGAISHPIRATTPPLDSIKCASIPLGTTVTISLPQSE